MGPAGPFSAQDGHHNRPRQLDLAGPASKLDRGQTVAAFKPASDNRGAAPSRQLRGLDPPARGGIQTGPIGKDDAGYQANQRSQ